MSTTPVKAHSEFPLGRQVRHLFPIFDLGSGVPIRYLDSAATSQKPRCVINRLTEFYSKENANIHRGAYRLSGEATARYEDVRNIVAKFIGASSPRSIVFCKGTTEAINLIAHSLGKRLSAGDTILLTILEHHSNIVPWQLLARERNLRVVYADCDDHARFSLDDFKKRLSADKPKIVAFTHVANAFGTVLPVGEMVSLCREHGAYTVIDAAQSVPHLSLNVEALGVDCAAFSAHKLYGPTGVGVLYGRESLLESLEPYQGGGDMIRVVTTEGSQWADVPHKFEAGTPPIAEVIGLGAAVQFLTEIGIERVAAHEHRLLLNAVERLSSEPGVTVYGPAMAGGEQASAVAFNLQGIHSHDVATVADSFNVQLRSGHHCAMPALRRLGIDSTSRISFGMYSDEDDLDPLLEAIRKARKIFG